MSLTYPPHFHFAAADQSFRYHHGRDERPNPEHYKPHYEKGYEIYMFISGEGTYTIEGNKYSLEPYSILMMNSDELHVLNISEDCPYERVVLTIAQGFLPPFLPNGVDFFRSIKFRKLGHGNQIKADIVQSSGLLDLLWKLEEQLQAPGAESEIVAKCILVQILSAINRIAESGSPRTFKRANVKIGAVLEYINSSLDQPLTLDGLAERFFVNKYHLCHTFKEETGFSINRYISYKRVRMADELMRQGHPPTEACFMSGFNCYSNFFKSYRKLTGQSPRSGKT
ncbi:helix-turn-helix domain-containing protein [Gorillibacterium sp. sgz5001074]|uniref:helix-turn-helix domain-containing protein n=1 Tax=Gorillibacterium sp. sgz5001074 TaxID=3446695 RepID=UPI003F680948